MPVGDVLHVDHTRFLDWNHGETAGIRIFAEMIREMSKDEEGAITGRQTTRDRVMVDLRAQCPDGNREPAAIEALLDAPDAPWGRN